MIVEVDLDGRSVGITGETEAEVELIAAIVITVRDGGYITAEPTTHEHIRLQLYGIERDLEDER